MQFGPKSLMMGLGGLGLAAIENRYVGSELPEPLKNVNLGIGGITGLLAADPQYYGAALASLPVKELGLFGIGALDKLRHQQQSLVDANLGVANINRDTAETQRSNAGSQRAMQLAFLIPALAGGGAAAMWALDKWKKQQGIPRYKTMGEKGRSSSARSKIRIDIPTSAVPPEFYKTLSEPEEQNRAHIRLLELTDPNRRKQTYDDITTSIPDEEQSKMAAFLKKAYADDDRISTPRFIADMASELIGIPSVVRSVKDLSSGFQGYQHDDPGKFIRYGLSGLGGAAMALASARFAAPGLARIIGLNRLAQHTGLAAKYGPEGMGLLERMSGKIPAIRNLGFATQRSTKPLVQFPSVAKWLLDHTKLPGQTYSDFEARRLARFAPNPNAFAWNRRAGGAPITMENPLAKNEAGVNALRAAGGRPTLPATESPTLERPFASGGESFVGKGMYRLFSAPKQQPASLPGQILNVGRYGGNRALQAAYNTKQLIGRNPTTSMFLLGGPFAAMGAQRDEAQDTRARHMLRNYVPDWSARRGGFGMPITGTMANISKLIGLPDNASGIRDQILAPRQYLDNFDWRH